LDEDDPCGPYEPAEAAFTRSVGTGDETPSIATGFDRMKVEPTKSSVTVRRGTRPVSVLIADGCSAAFLIG
jgi:hypothetical protein